jgi:hypothetical protein
VATTAERIVSELNQTEASTFCTFVDGNVAEIPPFLGRFVRPHDTLTFLAPTYTECLVQRQQSRKHPQRFLFATIGYVSQPKMSNGAGYLVRGDLPRCSGKPSSIVLSATALRRYFYLFENDSCRSSLYALFGCL